MDKILKKINLKTKILVYSFGLVSSLFLSHKYLIKYNPDLAKK